MTSNWPPKVSPLVWLSRFQVVVVAALSFMKHEHFFVRVDSATLFCFSLLAVVQFVAIASLCNTDFCCDAFVVVVAVALVVIFLQVQRAKRLTAHMTAYDLCWSAMGMLNYWVGDGKYLGAYEASRGKPCEQSHGREERPLPHTSV